MPKRAWRLNGRRANNLVKSIQVVTQVMDNQTTVNTAINAVDMANTLLFQSQYNNDNGPGAADFSILVQLTTATNLRFDVNTIDAGAKSISVQVVEFWPGVIRAVERGTKTANGSNTVTLTNNFTARAFVVWLGVSATGGSLNTGVQMLVLTPPNTLSITNSVTGNSTVGYQVAEFY